MTARAIGRLGSHGRGETAQGIRVRSDGGEFRNTLTTDRLQAEFLRYGSSVIVRDSFDTPRSSNASTATT